MSDVDTGLEWLDSWVASVNAPTQSAVEQSIRGTFPRAYRRIGVAAVPDEFLQFTPAEIRRHAGSVDGVADAGQTARGAVHEVAMDTQAYGQLCQFLPTILSQIFSLATGALNDAEDSLRETADKLRSTRQDLPNGHDCVGLCRRDL